MELPLCDVAELQAPSFPSAVSYILRYSVLGRQMEAAYRGQHLIPPARRLVLEKAVEELQQLLVGLRIAPDRELILPMLLSALLVVQLSLELAMGGAHPDF